MSLRSSLNAFLEDVVTDLASETTDDVLDDVKEEEALVDLLVRGASTGTTVLLFLPRRSFFSSSLSAIDRGGSDRVSMKLMLPMEAVLFQPPASD